MVTGWRRAFCTSIPKERDPKVAAATSTEKQRTHHSCLSTNNTSGRSPRFSSRFNFFSSSSSSSCRTPPSRAPRPHTPPVAPGGASPILPCWMAEVADSSTPPPSSASTPPLCMPESTDQTDTHSSCSSPTTLRCRIANMPRAFFSRSSNPSSPAPRSPSAFSLFKTDLHLSSSSSKAKSNSKRCGICTQTTKPGHGGTAVYTAECSHAFHSPCLARHVLVGKNGGLTCPVCCSLWRESPSIPFGDGRNQQYYSTGTQKSGEKKINYKLRAYNDDEPLMSPTAGARFNSIPEADENGDQDDLLESGESEEFQGFFTATPRRIKGPDIVEPMDVKDVGVKISPEAAVIAVDRSYQIYTTVLKVKAPTARANTAWRAPIDLVVAIDVGTVAGRTATPASASEGEVSSVSRQLRAVRRAMRLVVSSLSSSDRLSIIAFSGTSKRLLPLKRMTSPGRRSARRVVDALIVPGGGGGASCVSDALRKAAKILEDRRERNPVASLLLLSDSSSEEDPGRRSPFLSSTRYSHIGIPLHFLSLGGRQLSEPSEEAFAKCIRRLLNVVASDLRLQLRFAAGSAAGEISAAYTLAGRPSLLSPGSPQLGDLYAEEEREILLELRVPASAVGSHHTLAVLSFYRDPLTRETIYGKEQTVTVPCPQAVRSSERKIQQLRSLFLVTRAVAEARRLADRGDLVGAFHLLTSARSLLTAQSWTSTAALDKFRWMVEAEMAEVEQRRRVQLQAMTQRQRRWTAVPAGARAEACIVIDEKGEQLTPTSAWKAAERLAKVAVMRKSMNRVSDLHGFENARF